MTDISQNDWTEIALSPIDDPIRLASWHLNLQPYCPFSSLLSIPLQARNEYSRPIPHSHFESLREETRD